MLKDTAAAAAKSLQSCPTLYDPIDSSPPGFPVPTTDKQSAKFRLYRKNTQFCEQINYNTGKKIKRWVKKAHQLKGVLKDILISSDVWTVFIPIRKTNCKKHEFLCQQKTNDAYVFHDIKNYC